ncbi:transposable element Tcb2 transposase [Trichonephila clavipes]|uniref:Transposable element Tcb2 transposase n=1 Tax=Trichonephila clavipes TaxID=2585209 RepID=A0A8X6WDT4_TRICX|nr:transposable element Tcb2 transposase [Trichonephila clavipes]
MEWNQHRWTCGPAYHSEWHFDGPKVCRRDTSTSCHPIGAIGDSFVFQDDNARPHRARLVENMLQAETIQRMEWPACSSDLNSIEHAWDMLGRRIAARPSPPATVRDLEIALLEEWDSIPQSLIDNLIASMANMCAAVLAFLGDHTPY